MTDGKIKFWCSSCKYKFQRKAKPNMCPYCSKPTVEDDRSRGAEDLLREVSEIGRE
jgi:rubrerythrin